VSLVGAGPGDPELLTVKAARCLASAEVVVHDALVSRAILELTPGSAERFDVGKRRGHHRVPQQEINELLVKEGRKGRRVVRLKGGDPFVFGRGGEEALALALAGIPFEIVPGVSSGVAAPAYAGIPVTHRGIAPAVTLVTGHECERSGGPRVDFRALASVPGTLVVFMGLRGLGAIVAALLEGGKDPHTPAALIASGTTGSQLTLTGSLREIPLQGATLRAPVLLVVGEVVALRGALQWIVEGTGGEEVFAGD
jgi:uroporphyrin-III C-methyltransferase